MGFPRRHILAFGCLVALATTSGKAQAVTAPSRQYDLPSQDLKFALRAVTHTAGLELYAETADLRGKRSPEIHGTFTPSQALDQLLAGSGLEANIDGKAVVIRGRSLPAGATEGHESQADIVVTGTRIRGTAPTGSHVITLGREAIEASGYDTVQGLLQTLPQNYGGGANEATSGVTGANGANLDTAYGSSVNLRGLGATSTLVLLNGNRVPLGGIGGAFADVSMLPTSAIERIEVLPDGASAIYGSDAVAGVVNIIPRSNFKGLEVSARYGSADGDLSQSDASAIGGVNWDGGHAVIAYEYNDSGRLHARDRSFATEDLRRFGGPDYRTASSNPGNILANGEVYPIPTGQDGSALTSADLVAGSPNLRDAWTDADLTAKQRRHSVYASASQRFGDHLTFSVEGLYSARHYNKRDNDPYTNIVEVPTTNPFYTAPNGVSGPLEVEYSFGPDFGPLTDYGSLRLLSVSFGPRLDLGPWRLTLTGGYGQDVEHARTANLPNTARLEEALADPDPATSFNVFGDGSWTSPKTIAKVRGSYGSNDRDVIWTAAAKADGPLLRLPGGDVRLAVGAEYRHERFSSSSFDDSEALTTTYSKGVWPGARKVAAIYGEILAPLVGEDNSMFAVQSLTLSAAVRHEHYNEFGSTTNPKLGLAWAPFEGLSVRSTIGRSFRAPSFDNLLQTPNSSIYFVYPLADPKSPTGVTNTLVLAGNGASIGPERATTWTAGIDLAPKVAPGFKVSATYFHVRYRDRIVTPTSTILAVLQNRAVYAPLITDSPNLSTVQSYYDSSYFRDFFGIPASQVCAIVDNRTQNLSVVVQTGLDVEATYSLPFAHGTLGFDVDGTYLFKIDQGLTPSSQKVDIVNTVNNPVSLRLRGGASWSNGRLFVSAHANFTNSYRNTIVSPSERVSSWTTVDAQLGYTFTQKDGVLHGLKASLSATNLFDRDPPYVAFLWPGALALGYDPQNASPIGRVVSLQLTKAW